MADMTKAQAREAVIASGLFGQVFVKLYEELERDGRSMEEFVRLVVDEVVAELIEVHNVDDTTGFEMFGYVSEMPAFMVYVTD